MTPDEVPFIDEHDLKAALVPLLAAERAHFLFAVHGRGDEQHLRFDNAPPMTVISVRSEIELRAKLPAITDLEPRFVFLVPWTQDLPLDLSGRFARHGRVLRIGREARLRHLFGVPDVDADAVRSPLAEWLLRPGAARKYVVRESRLTLDAMWAAWLREDWGLDMEGGLALDALLGWAALDGRGQAFAKAVTELPALRPALLEVLRASLGSVGPTVWRAWEEGRGRAVLEYAVLFEALAPSDNAGVRMWIKLRSRAELGIIDDADVLAVPKDLGKVAGSALRYFERRSDAAVVRALLRSAEGRVDDPEIRVALRPSARLPASFKQRLDDLGDVLLAAAVAPSLDAVARAEQSLRAVEGHALAGELENPRQLERAWMAARLLAWLAVRTDRLLVHGAAPHGPVETLGPWYAEEGGYIDWARRWARGTADTAFGRGVQAIVEAADSARTELDRTFARALVDWTTAERPASHVVPIEKAIERVAAKFLEENDERRLLILLLDGMAWAQTVELLESLSSKRAWGPLAWHATKKGRIGPGSYPAVLAGIPSMTEISRSAFFASKAVPAGRSEDTQKDRERFRDNRHMGKFIPLPDVPTLLLKAESHTKGGAATEEALSLVADPDRRVVAIVLNAIDDALKANPTTRHPWGVDNIHSLADLLDKARASGRAVLLASDHGHVPADRLESKGAIAGGGARWRPLLTEKDPVQSFEVAFPATRAWAPKGAWGVALLADDASRWGGASHAGEHGGATLAEIVAPCVLVGWEDMQGASSDDALGIRAPFVPPWWHLTAEARTVIEITPSAPKLPSEAVKQLSLPDVAPPPVEAKATPPKKPSQMPASAFARSKVLEARAPDPSLRKEVSQAVDFLIVRNGVATAAAFAAEMGVLQRRSGGLVAKLQEVLNVDGYEVLRFDAVALHVTLDIGKLRLLFEVPS